MAKDDDNESYKESESQEEEEEEELVKDDDASATASEGTSVRTDGETSSTWEKLTSSEKTNIRKRKRQRSRKNEDDLSDQEQEDGDIDSSLRMTAKGGYAHTNKSKMRISRANKGNTPWNKGGNRSAADRAKISAGVRARNRAILLEKLKKLGMTEEEWVEKKKQIKYLRERVRRAKVVKDQQLVAEKERELQIALDNNETPGTTVMPATQPKKKKGKTNEAERKTSNKEGKTKKRRGDQSTVDCEKQRTTMSPSETHQSAQTATVPTPTGGKRSKKESSSTTNLSTQTAVVQAAPQYATFFARDISWTPHQYHESSSQDSSSYEKDCPNGGPGGLICCAACTKKYSSFLSDTTKEIEKQRMHKVNGEVMELLGYLSDAKLKLGTGLQVTKSRTGTGPMQKMITNSKRKAKNTQPAPKTKKKALAPQVRSKKTQKSEPCQAEPLALEDDPFTDKEPLPLLPQPELCSDSPVTLRQPHNGQSQHVISYELPFDNDQSHQGSTGQKCDVEEPEEAIETVAV